MGRPARVRQGKTTAARLRESALRLFARQGYRAATLAEVAAGAGISKRTLFHYFRNKRELYRRVLAEACAGVESGRPHPDWCRLLIREHLERGRAFRVDPRVLAVAVFSLNRIGGRPAPPPGR